MFGPLGFVPGITPAQLEASTRRGGWKAAGVPTGEDYTKVGAWFAGPPEELVAHLRSLEEKFPGRAAHMESDQTGLHTTATIDLIYILSGEVSLELDDAVLRGAR